MDIPLMMQALSRCAQPQRDVAMFLIIATCDEESEVRQAFASLTPDAKRVLWNTCKRVDQQLKGKR
jgi:hypothetical protein